MESIARSGYLWHSDRALELRPSSPEKWGRNHRWNDAIPVSITSWAPQAPKTREWCSDSANLCGTCRSEQSFEAKADRNATSNCVITMLTISEKKWKVRHLVKLRIKGHSKHIQTSKKNPQSRHFDALVWTFQTSHAPQRPQSNVPGSPPGLSAVFRWSTCVAALMFFCYGSMNENEAKWRRLCSGI